MNNINCPNCGTAYQETKAGFCDCCGYEFTPEYINKLLLKEKEQEKIIQKKIATENRQKQILLKKEEKERKQKAKAGKKAKEKEQKLYYKEKKGREKIKNLVEKNNKRYESDIKFSLIFKRFRQLTATLGIVLVLLTVIGSAVFAEKLNVNLIAPQNIIADKLESVYNKSTVIVEYDEEKGMLTKTRKTDESVRLTKSTVNFLNSIFLLFQKQKNIDEKLEFMFPKTVEFIDNFINTSNETKNKNSVSDKTEYEGAEKTANN